MKECIIEGNSGDRHLDGSGVPEVAFTGHTDLGSPVRTIGQRHRTGHVGANVPRRSRWFGGYPGINPVTVTIMYSVYFQAFLAERLQRC